MYGFCTELCSYLKEEITNYFYITNFFASIIDVQKEYLKTLKCTSKIIFYLMLTGKSQSCDKFNTLYPVGKITEQSVH